MADKVIDIPGVGSVAFPDSMSDAQLNAAATKLYKEAHPTKKQPPVKSWADTATDWLPTVTSAAGSLIGAEAGPPGIIAGAGVGGMVGDALKQGINKLRGAAAPETVSGALGEMAGETATDAASATLGVAAGAAIPAVGAAMRVTGEATHAGAETLRALLASGDPASKLAKLAIPKLAYAPAVASAGGKALAITGRTLEKLGEPSEAAVAKAAIQRRLERMPLQERLAAIREQGAAVANTPPAPYEVAIQQAKEHAATLDNLSDDVKLIRESIGMKMAPDTAIRIVANGDKAYYDVLKAALLKSVQEQGVPPPKAVSDLLKTPTFQRLSQP